MSGRAAPVVLFMGIAGLVLPVAVAAAASVSTADLARCAGIAVADARLACYDALAERALTAAAPQARPPAAPAADAGTFGLTKPAPRATPAGPELIKALVAKVTANRVGNVDVLLDNGQTWIVVASDPLLKPGDSVTIKRAALGSFLMSAPARRSYRVRRME
jgi:hypothetical protein